MQQSELQNSNKVRVTELLKKKKKKKKSLADCLVAIISLPMRGMSQHVIIQQGNEFVVHCTSDA